MNIKKNTSVEITIEEFGGQLDDVMVRSNSFSLKQRTS